MKDTVLINSEADVVPERTVPSVLGNGVLLAVALAGAQYSGGAIFSQRSDPEEDAFVKKEEIRRRFRRPANEMINEIGEGRGMSLTGHNQPIEAGLDESSDWSRTSYRSSH